ncbi:MAG: hypothetical protein RLZZ84_2239 [Pseudomonadota bacterium]|jgi:hypothetical protein
MRVAIPHSHPREEVRRRMRERSSEIAGLVPGGADVQVTWANEDRMDFSISAMGKTVASRVEIGESEIAIVIDLPPALAFVEPMVRGAVEAKGRKLLA